MSDGNKICILCRQSCVGQPRIKNDKGQYAHQACVKAKQEQKMAVVEEPLYEDDYSDALGGEMDDLLGDIESQSDIGSAAACPGCGKRLGDESVVCMGCGYNTQSGKTMSTVSKKEKSGDGIGGAAMGGAVAVGGFAAGPTLAFVGAIIGGTIGATIWAAIAYFTGFEIGWIAIGVGVLVGLGAQLGGGTQSTGGGMIVGVMAAIVAVASIAGGKYGASYMFVRDAYGTSISDSYTLDDVTDEWVFGRLVDEVCQEQIDAGETITWDDPTLFVDAAFWPDDYPLMIKDMVNYKWDGLDSNERIALRKGFAAEIGYDYTFRDIDEEWALSLMADKVIITMLDNGEAIEWPNQNLAMDAAIWPDDYPEAIQTLTNERWSAMSDDEQLEYRTTLMDSGNEMREVFAEAITQGSFINSFMHPLDLLFLVLAMGAAYQIGYGD